MTNEGPQGGERPKLAPPLKIALATVAALGAAALLYGMGSAFIHPGPEYKAASGPAGSSISSVDAAAHPDPAKVPAPSLKGTGDMPPDAAFTGPDGKPRKLSDFAGKVVVLNLWATWCPPCRKEVPSLAQLAASLKGEPVEVVALSVDTDKATDKAKAFIAQNAPLAFYQDASMSLPFKFSPAVEGFPTTFLIDKTGRIRSRAPMDKDWTSPAIRKVIDKLAAE